MNFVIDFGSGKNSPWKDILFINDQLVFWDGVNGNPVEPGTGLIPYNLQKQITNRLQVGAQRKTFKIDRTKKFGNIC